MNRVSLYNNLSFNIVFHFYQCHIYKSTKQMWLPITVVGSPELHCMIIDNLVFLTHDSLLLPSLQEKYKRALADTENLRTRSQKMIEDAKIYGNDKCSTFQYVPHELYHAAKCNLCGLNKNVYSCVFQPGDATTGQL